MMIRIFLVQQGRTKVTSEMGLIGKVSDARIKLENIYNMKQLPSSDPKES